MQSWVSFQFCNDGAVWIMHSWFRHRNYIFVTAHTISTGHKLIYIRVYLTYLIIICDRTSHDWLHSLETLYNIFSAYYSSASDKLRDGIGCTNELGYAIGTYLYQRHIVCTTTWFCTKKKKYIYTRVWDKRV